MDIDSAFDQYRSVIDQNLQLVKEVEGTIRDLQVALSRVHRAPRNHRHLASHVPEAGGEMPVL